MPGPTDPTDVSASDGWLPLPPELSPRGRSRDRQPRSGRRRVARYASWTAVTASVLVLVLSAGAFAYYEHLNGNIHRVPVFGNITTKRPATAKDGAENILLVGDDSRTGETAAELHAESTTDDGGSDNTDTIIILHLAPNDGPATLISIPRDSYVAIPGHGMTKINAAYADGEAEKKGDGPSLLTSTVENLTGLHIDHFISVGFGQFINISNAIGGVQVCVVNPSLSGYEGRDEGTVPTADIHGAWDKYTGTSLSMGVHTISGGAALSFVRQRHDLPGGDLDRIHRQQRFITAIAAKAESERNPATINQILEKATQSLTVDSGLSGIKLAQLGNRLKNLKPADIRFATIPVANSNYYLHGVSYVQLNMTKLATFFANVQAERDPNAAAPNPLTTVSAATPGDVHLTVLNASRVSGAASRTRNTLETYGFVVDSVGDATSTTATTIAYNAADAAAAKELAKAVPGATLTADDNLATGTVQLTLGSSFTGVQNPATAVTTPPATPTTTAPSASPSTSTSDGTTSAASLDTGLSIDGVPCGP